MVFSVPLYKLGLEDSRAKELFTESGAGDYIDLKFIVFVVIWPTAFH